MCSQLEGFCLLGIRVIWDHFLMACNPKVGQPTNLKDIDVRKEMKIQYSVS